MKITTPNPRHYFPLLLTILLITIMSITQSSKPADSRAIPYPFAHHVFFWLNNPDNAAERAQFEKAVEELLTIPEIKAYHFGTPAPVEERPVIDGSYTYSYIVFFENIEAQQVYQDHPVHLKFIDENKHLWEKVKVYDSE